MQPERYRSMAIGHRQSGHAAVCAAIVDGAKLEHVKTRDELLLLPLTRRRLVLEPAGTRRQGWHCSPHNAPETWRLTQLP